MHFDGVVWLFHYLELRLMWGTIAHRASGGLGFFRSTSMNPLVLSCVFIAALAVLLVLRRAKSHTPEKMATTVELGQDFLAGMHLKE